MGSEGSCGPIEFTPRETDEPSTRTALRRLGEVRPARASLARLRYVLRLPYSVCAAERVAMPRPLKSGSPRRPRITRACDAGHGNLFPEEAA